MGKLAEIEKVVLNTKERITGLIECCSNAYTVTIGLKNIKVIAYDEIKKILDMEEDGSG